MHDNMPRWIEYRPIDELPGNPRNAKAHDNDLLGASLERFGVIEAVVLDERTGFLVAGHGRRDTFQAAHDAGEDPPEGVVVADDGRWTVPLMRGWASEDDLEADAATVALNQVGSVGGWDDAKLVDILGDLAAGPGLAGIGFDDADLAELLGDEDVGGFGDGEGAIPEPPPVPVTKVGDVWLLGPHRVVCGDSLDDEVRKHALGGQTPGVVYTDPPYGMNLDTDYSSLAGGKEHRPVIGDDQPFDAGPLIDAFADVDEQFWWGADYYRLTIPSGGSWIVWDKRSTDDALGQYDDLVMSAFELCWSRQPHSRKIARFLWATSHGRDADGEARDQWFLHPTQKPVALASWFLEQWAPEGGVVVDLFGGSGSSLMAAEATGRTACLVELDPGYVDVICRRYQAETGTLPILEATGEPHDFCAEV